MVHSLSNAYLVCIIFFVCLLPLYARNIHTVHVRSVEGQQETESTQETLLGGDQSTRLPSQVNQFQYLLPFWWHYLRPMLNIFAMDTNFRQALQKEYEHEFEHGSMNEMEPSNIEREDVQVVEHAEGNEVEITENNTERKLTQPPDDWGLESSLVEGENTMNSNNFGLLGTEHEANEQTSNMFSENEVLRENDGASPEGLSNMELEQVSSETDAGETPNWGGSENAPWQFGLTGNIVDAFSNSLMGLMPSIKQETEFNENIETTGNEMNTETFSSVEHNEAGTLEFNEAEPNFDIATKWDLSTILETGEGFGHSEEHAGDQGGQHQTDGFLTEGFLREISDGQIEESSTLFGGESAPFQTVDPDSSDNIEESFAVSTFAPPSNFFAPNFDSQNEHDSSS